MRPFFNLFVLVVLAVLCGLCLPTRAWGQEQTYGHHHIQPPAADTRVEVQAETYYDTGYRSRRVFRGERRILFRGRVRGIRGRCGLFGCG